MEATPDIPDTDGLKRESEHVLDNNDSKPEENQDVEAETEIGHGVKSILKHPDETEEITKSMEEATEVQSELAEEGKIEGAETEIERKKAAKRMRLKQSRTMRFTINEGENEISYVVDTDTTQQEDNDANGGTVDVQAESTTDTDLATPSIFNQGTDDESAEEAEDAETMEVRRLLMSDSDGEDDDLEPGPVKGGDSVKAKSEFLKYFLIPSMSDISLDPSEITQRKSSLSIRSAQGSIVDKGKFVDPLTGESLESSSSSSSSKSSSSSSSVASESLEAIPDITIDSGLATIPARQEEDEDLFVRFQISTISLDGSSFKSDGSLEYRHQKQLHQVTMELLNELFANVVDEAENVQAEVVLRHRLDKLKLHSTLLELKNRYLVEKELNSYLNTKLCDYSKRMKNYRAITALPLEVSERECERHKAALSMLDHQLNIEAEAKKKGAYLMSSVLMDLSYVQNIVMRSEKRFEDVVLKTLGNKSDHIKKVTERELRLMRQKRNEISDTRLFMITRKHTLGRISDQIHKLEQIDENLCMEDFINIQNQTAALFKKIEERNNDLKKLRYTYHTELHLAQHNREKILAILKKLKDRQKILAKTQQRQRELREELYMAKLERARMRKQHSDLSYQGGLLSLPSLMHDFDKTVEKVKDKQDEVKELKKTLKLVTQRIVDLEARCI